MAVSDYSITPSLNISISGINIGEGCAPANINNAMRQMMADIKGYTSVQIPFNPAAGIIATTVQEAILEARADAIAAIPGAATATTPGLMSAADKVKLNGIASEAGVTAPIATEAQAQAGVNDTATMTPLRVEQHMLANGAGWGQVWVDVTTSRVRDTVYSNETGRPIFLSLRGQGGGWRLQVRSSSAAPWVTVAIGDSSAWPMVGVPIPAGHEYRHTGEGVTLPLWAELR